MSIPSFEFYQTIKDDEEILYSLLDNKDDVLDWLLDEQYQEMKLKDFVQEIIRRYGSYVQNHH